VAQVAVALAAGIWALAPKPWRAGLVGLGVAGGSLRSSP
jgi:hypothetical protein